MIPATDRDLAAVVHARVSPKGVLENLSQQEVDKLLDRGQGGLYPLFRRCALAVLNSGTLIDDARLIFDAYKDFELRIMREPWGIKLEMHHAPGSAFVDGEMIRGVKEHLFAVLRDIVYTHNEIVARFDLRGSRRASRTRFSASCGMPGCSTTRAARTWSCAGAGTRSRARNTTTPRRSATSWACAACRSAPAAARAR